MILDDIIEKRKIQLEREKSSAPLKQIKKRALEIKTPVKDFYSALKGNKLSVIAEVKKASPSKSVIKENFNPVDIAVSYQKSGADAISCLTEEFFFQGKSDYLKNIRTAVVYPYCVRILFLTNIRFTRQEQSEPTPFYCRCYTGYGTSLSSNIC